MERKCVQYMSNIVFPLGIDSFEKSVQKDIIILIKQKS